MIRNNLRKENTKLVKEKLSMFLCCKTYLKLYYSNMTQRGEFMLQSHLARNHFVKGTSVNFLTFSLESIVLNIPIKRITPKI